MNRPQHITVPAWDDADRERLVRRPGFRGILSGQGGWLCCGRRARPRRQVLMLACLTT
jgi:hypothetical protein